MRVPAHAVPWRVRPLIARRVVFTLAFTLSLASGIRTASAQIPTGAVAEWTFDETTGDAFDTSGEGNDGQLNGPVRTSAGHIDAALNFDTSGDYVSVASPSTTLKPTSFAVSAWINYSVTGTAGGEIASMGDAYGIRVGTSGEVIAFFHTGSTWRTATASTANAEGTGWHHVVGQYSGSALQVYVDGVQLATQSYSDSITYTGVGTAFILGKHGNGSTNKNYQGLMDQVRVYPRSLTGTEITELANENPFPPATAHWKFDETSGSVAADATGGGNDGTVTGALWTTGHVSGALQFDGNGDYVEVASPTSALQPANAFAISAWVNFSTTDTDGGEVASMGDAYGLRVMPTGYIRVFFYDSVTSNWKTHTTTTNSILNTGWHHIVGQFTGEELQVYVDGQFVSQAAVTGTIGYGGSLGTHFEIGRHGNGSTLKDYFGTIDEVRVYSEGLSDADIAVLASEGPATNQAPTISAFTATPSSGAAPLSVSFSVTASDPESDTLSYTWDFGNDVSTSSTTSTATNSYQYNTAGTYLARVTVRDTAGNSASASVTVTATGSSGSGRDVIALQWNVGKGRYYNTNGTRFTCNLTEVANYIASVGADIVSFNEIEPANNTYSNSCDTKTTGTAVGEPANMEDLLESITGVTWTKHVVGYNALFWRDSLPDSAPTSTDKGSWADSCSPTPCTPTTAGAAWVKMTIASRSMVFYSAHLTVDSISDEDREVTLLKTNISARSASNAVILGDFNFGPGSTPYVNMDNGYDDAWSTAVGLSTQNGDGRTTKGGNRWDYIWLTTSAPNASVVAAWTAKPMQQINPPTNNDTVYLSDHHPLHVKINIQ